MSPSCHSERNQEFEISGKMSDEAKPCGLTPSLKQDQLCAADLILQILMYSYACVCPSVQACQSVTIVADTEDDLKEVYEGVIYQ